MALKKTKTPRLKKVTAWAMFYRGSVHWDSFQPASRFGSWDEVRRYYTSFFPGLDYDERWVLRQVNVVPKDERSSKVGSLN